MIVATGTSVCWQATSVPILGPVRGIQLQLCHSCAISWRASGPQAPRVRPRERASRRDRAGELAAEVEPVLELLEDTDAECHRVIEQARRDAEQITAAARAEATAIAADAGRRAAAVREQAARQEMALALDEAARAADSARQQAEGIHDLARQRMPALVSRAVDMIRQLPSGAP